MARAVPMPSFRRLKRIVTVEQVLADRGLLDGLRRRGDDLVGPCPVHGGDNPGAFVVSRSKNAWHCFTGCSGGGDVVELARRLEGGSYVAAGRYLAGLADAECASPAVTNAASGVVASRPQGRAFRRFEWRLPLDHATPFLADKGIAAATARSFEAGAWHGGGFLRGCVAVRLRDLGGRPLGYAGRRMKGEEARRWGKWRLPRGLPKGRLLYGWHRVAGRLCEGLVVVEGAWGVMRLAQVGVPAVALMGAWATERQCALLAQARRVVVMLDGDEAGKTGARRLSRLLEHRVDVRVFELGEGADPDDLDEQGLGAARGLLSL